MVQFGNQKKVKLFNPIRLPPNMGKYTDKLTLQMDWNRYYSPHGALISYFDELLDIWGEFDTLWRQSYGPPIHNKEALALILADMHYVHKECKALYSRLRLDPNGIEGITRIPAKTTILHHTPPLNSLKKPKKGQNTSPKGHKNTKNEEK